MTLSAKPLLKVTAFVTRTRGDGEHEVVLIDHPHGGIQFPAGTMEEGEAPAVAARREAWEETGLSAFGETRAVGEYEVEMPSPQAAILRRTPVYMRPRGDAESMASLRNGLGVSIARSQDGFVQLTYAQHEDVEREILSAQIVGWAPQEAITRHVRRYFFVLPFTGQAPATWMHTADHHHWRLFWAPVAALPPIVAGQAGWVDYLRRAL